MKLGEAGEAFFVEQISQNDIDVSYIYIIFLIFEVNYVFIVYYIMKIIIYEDNLAKILVNSSISACNYLYIYLFYIIHPYITV